MTISPQDFLKKYYEEKENLLLIDIRTHAEYLKGTISGAKNIPYSVLSKVPSKYLEFEKTYYIFCDEGYYTNKLLKELDGKGYKIIQIEGGYQAISL